MSVKKKASKRPQMPSDIVFDDDTDSDVSEEENSKPMDSEDEEESGSEADSEQQEASSDESEGDSSSEVEDSSEDEDVASKEKKKLRAKAMDSKIAKFKASLAKLKGSKVEEDSDEEEEDSDDEEEDSDEEEESEEGEEEEEESEEEEEEEPEPAPKKAKKDPSPAARNAATKPTKTTEEDERAAIRAELKQMSIEEIQALKEKLGLKVFNQTVKPQAQGRGGEKPKVFKRENPNRPREISTSRKAVSRFRDVVGVSSETNKKMKTVRDPRFDSACGEFNDTLFKKSYSFVDDVRAKEREQLAKQLEDETDEEEIKKIKYLIQRYDNQLRERKKLDAKKAALEEEKTENKRRLKAGERPLFQSKAARKDKELVDKFEDLKKRGALDNYMKKKAKKNLAKDRRKFGQSV